MKAAVFRGPNRPLEISEVATPSPAVGEVLVRVAGCGLCHTDLHYIDHGVKSFKPPRICTRAFHSTNPLSRAMQARMTTSSAFGGPAGVRRIFVSTIAAS